MTKIKTIRFFLLIVGLLSAFPVLSSITSGTLPQTTEIRDEIFNLELKAGFLVPGETGMKVSDKEEMKLSSISWLSPTYGQVQASIWKVVCDVIFETTDDRKYIQTLRIDPHYPKLSDNPWNLWRHRHGFVLSPGKGYFWNSLGEEPKPLDPELGIFYDHYLKDVWGYWIRKKLSAELQKPLSGLRRPLPVEDVESPSSYLKKPVRLKYTVQGLQGATPVVFQIKVWDVPVKINFELISTTATESGRLIGLANDYHWKYDMSEWRRRHGYSRTFWGGYEWDDDFPSRPNLSDTDGPKLDRLLDQTIAYWVEVSVEQVLFNLNSRFSKAIEDFAQSRGVPSPVRRKPT